MPSQRAIFDPWKSFFREIDSLLSEEVRLHCLGGFVMTMVHNFDRVTVDVDILPVGTHSDLEVAGQGSELHKKYKVYLQIVGVASVPMNYEDRLTEMFAGTFKRVRLFALDPYDLALSKLERNAARDREDFLYLAQKVPLNMEILANRYHEELRPDLGNPLREDLTLKLWIESAEERRNL